MIASQGTGIPGKQAMKVTKAQAQANRAHIVETASQLFRERGYDGVGVADLMAAAGFTHGGFYKQFGSKTDLIAESTACGLAQTVALTGNGADPETVEPPVAPWPPWAEMQRVSPTPSEGLSRLASSP